MKIAVTDVRVTVEGVEHPGYGNAPVVWNGSVLWSGTLDEYRERLDDSGAYLIFDIRDEDAWTKASFDHGTITSKRAD